MRLSGRLNKGYDSFHTNFFIPFFFFFFFFWSLYKFQLGSCYSFSLVFVIEDQTSVGRVEKDLFI